MILGDNIFYGNGLGHKLTEAKAMVENDQECIFGYYVEDPERFGIMEFTRNDRDTSDGAVTVLSVEEKTKEPKLNYAIVGLHFYPAGERESGRGQAVCPWGT